MKGLAYNRKKALERDNHKCRLCFEYKGMSLQVHHLTPKFLGGTNEIYNLITVCESCHMFLHCNPKMIIAAKKDHSERTKAGIKLNPKVGKRGKDTKPRKKRNTNINTPIWFKEEKLKQGSLKDFTNKEK